MTSNGNVGRLEAPTSRRQAIRFLGGASVAGVAAGTGTRHPAAALARHTEATSSSESTSLFSDGFGDGFRIDDENARWAHFAFPGPDGGVVFVGNDGTETMSAEGLQVVASGIHPDSGEPAFTLTVPQEAGATVPVPGGVDHVKWLAYTTHLASSGVPGFDAEAGEELVISARMSGRTFETASHPFGAAVLDPDDDLRLASVALNTIDLETWMVYDFWLTNTAIYAFYERLPFGRQQLGNYAAFSFQIPVGSRRPDDWNDLAIAYDRAAGTVRWLVDGAVAFRVNEIGHHIDRQYLTIDHGGEEQTVESRQLNGGMGLFTLLDGHLPSGQALVRLSNADDFYFNPTVGEPMAQTFFDEESAEASRCFGQGAELRVARFAVETRPAGS